jgi:hypothetical protein
MDSYNVFFPFWLGIQRRCIRIRSWCNFLANFVTFFTGYVKYRQLSPPKQRIVLCLVKRLGAGGA